MNVVTEFIRSMFATKPKGKPADLIEFDAARARLHEARKKVERDAFGCMVHGMSGRKPRRAAKRKGAKGSC